MTVQPMTGPGALASLPPIPTTEAAAPGLAAMRTWLDLADAAEQLVTPLLGSAFIPASFRTQGRDVTVERANGIGAVLLGVSLGLDPLTSLQQIYVVHGRPGMYSKLKVALAQARGHDVWAEEYTAERVTVCGRRAGWGEDRAVRVTLTIDDAKRAGWTTNDNYRKVPADMLWARAAGRVVDQIAADVLLGIASVEDLDDLPEPTRVTSTVTVADLPTAPPPAPRAVTAAPTPAPEPEATPSQRQANARYPEDGAVDRPAPDVERVVPPPNPDRLRDQMNRRFVELGVTGPGQNARRAAVCTEIVGRTVAKSADLTADDLALIVHQLAGENSAALVADVRARETIDAPPPAPATYDPTPGPDVDGEPWNQSGSLDPDAQWHADQAEAREAGQ